MNEYLFFETPVTSYELSDQLMHHGVKGMKWGVRKDRRSPFEKRYKNKNAIDLFDQMNKISYVSRPTVLDRMNLKQHYLEAKKNSFRRTLRNTPIDSKLEKAIKRYERASDKSWNEHERKPYDPDRHEKAIEETGRAYKQVTKEMLRSIGAKNLKDEDIQMVINHHWADEILDTYWGANPKYPLPLYPGMNVKDSKKVTHSDGTTDELYHHGILGMKWGVRRFQPYGPGQKVKGGKEVGIATKVKQRVTGTVEGIKQHRAAKKEAKAAKKAEAERKAQAEHQLSKQQAIEKGTIEDLAKFKGELTNEEYGRAFARLQNEQRLEAMVAANQKTAWDTMDKGMEIVNKLAGYAGTVANAKNKFDAMSDALNRKKDKQKAEDELREKNKFLTNIHDITELNEGMDKHKITPQEYNAALNLLANKKVKQATYGSDFEDQNERAAREQAERDKADYTKWAGEQAWKQYNREQAKNAWNAQKEAQRQAKREANAPKDGQWWQDDPSMNNGPYSGGGKGGGYRGEKWGKRPASSSSRYGEVGTNKTNQLMLTMKDQTPSSYGSDKRSLKGAKSGPSGTVKNTGTMEFGDKTMLYKKSTGSDRKGYVQATRNAVDATQQERARQKEVDKKRRSTLRHSALDLTPTELAHHGIKGQKWGVRRFQDKTGKRTAAGRIRAKSQRLMSKISDMDEATKTEGIRLFSEHYGKSISTGGDMTWANPVDKVDIETEERVFPDGRKIYPAIGTVIKDFENAGLGNPYPGPKDITAVMMQGGVNPNYGDPGTTNNCTFCSAALELAGQGYAVCARRALGGVSADSFERWFDGAKTKVSDTWDEMTKELDAMPEGASGVLQGYYGSGLGDNKGGHSVHWSKKYGQLWVEDGQINKTHTLSDTKDFYGFGEGGCCFTRLDGCKPNWDAIAEDGVIGVNSESRRWKRTDTNTVYSNF